MIVKSSVFFAAFGYADITPPAARVQIRKAFSQSFDKRFFRVLLSVIRKRYEIIPTVKIRFATESFFALPDIAHFTSEILFDEVFDIGQFDKEYEDFVPYYMDKEDLSYVDEDGNVVDFTSLVITKNTAIKVMWKSP